LQPDISQHGPEIDALINFLHIFMAILFGGWGIYLVYCLIKFRQRAGVAACYTPIKAKFSKAAEITVVIVETFLLVGISMPIWASYKNDPPDPNADPPPLTVRVVAQQFAWNVHYPGPDGKFGKTRPELVDEASAEFIGLDRDSEGGADDIVLQNQLYLPVNRPVIVRLTSKDVIHCFSVPLLRVKQDVVPGMEIPIWFTANKTSDEVRQMMERTVAVPAKGGSEEKFLRFTKNCIAVEDYNNGGEAVLTKGTIVSDSTLLPLQEAGTREIKVTPREPIEIQCAQLCGNSHYRMRGEVIVLSDKEFAEWYAKAAEPEQAFDEEDFED